MTLPLPDWVPWWAQLAILVVAILFGLAFLMMPFAVFGLKGRLDFLEAQLDDIHAELRMLAMRLPEAGRPPEAGRRNGRDTAAAEATVEPVTPPRFVSDSPRRPAPVQPVVQDPYDDEEPPPRRPLRATGRDEGIPARRPREIDRDRDPDRAEPTLRWPPRPDRPL